jgi:hypothetical protein
MTRLLVCLGILTCVSTLFAQQPVQRGIDQAERAEAQNQRDIPSPMNQRPIVDPAKLKHDADELAALAQSVPPEVDQTAKGALPKDLSEKLKRIEKLAKQLRSRISQ